MLVSGFWLQVGAEHPEREHVEQDVPEPKRVMQEHVCDELPQCQVADNVTWNQTERLPNPRVSCQNGEVIEDKQSDVADQQPFDALR